MAGTATLLVRADRYFAGVEQVGNPEADKRGRWDTLLQRATTGQVRIVHIVFGYAAANRFFWIAPRKGKLTWTDVLNRVEWLAARNQQAAVHFVRASLARTDSASVVIGLSRHAQSRAATRDALAEIVSDPESLWPRIEDNASLAGAFAGAARLLLDLDAARSFVIWLTDRSDVVPANLFQVMDAVGFRSASVDDLDSRIKTTREARHRLVITESLDEPGDVSFLLPGAKAATLVATSDTYGQAEVVRFKAPKDAELTVEHVRSRITRFSQGYVDLHDATVEVAEKIAAEFFENSDLIRPAYRQSVEVNLADYLFFHALRIRALDLLLDDDDFDHIVVATNHEPGDAFVRQISGVDRLLTDPRVEVVSVARKSATYRQFWDVVAALAGGDTTSDVRRPRIPADVIRHKYVADANKRARRLPVFTGKASRPAVLMATVNNAAYNKATAAYAAALSDVADVHAIHVGPEPGDLLGLLGARANGGVRIPTSVLAVDGRSIGSLALHVEDAIRPALDRPGPADATVEQRVAFAASHVDVERLCRAFARFLHQLKALDTWFDRMAEGGSLPDAVVLTPQRFSGVSAVAAAARLHGVPSIAVEPHAQDANYCRYMKVGADYYGVLSDYFRDQAAAGFGIEAERIRVLGSPRQVAQSTFDRPSGRRAARALLQKDHGLTLDAGQVLVGFFSQPSAWAGTKAVWSMTLEAARATGAKVLLKPHPEDSPSRIRQYLAAAGKGEVLVFQGDVNTAIDASDLVTTTYSIVGLDATLRRAPVVALADGDAAYPLDLASILGVPVVRSAAELAKTIVDFEADPTPFTERVERFLSEESQFIEGPGPRLRQLLDEVVRRGTSGIRPAEDVPDHYFLDGPHPVFPV